MSYLRYLLFILSFFLNGVLYSQDVHSAEHHLTLKAKDSASLKECFRHAHWEAHTRSFIMSTINERDLKDDYAVATGAGIGILTKPLCGFQLGISGFFIYNLYSSNLAEHDKTTGLSNRYEIGLFDLEDPKNKDDLDRLEELYLSYRRLKLSISAGKMILNTPFFNPQDGRMRPAIAEGIWFSTKIFNKISVNGGYIWKVSPRSTIKWYSLANSIGVYNSGVTVTGKKSEYAGNIDTQSGMVIANLAYEPFKGLKVNIWDGYLDNIMNTVVAETNSEQLRHGKTFYENIMFIHQDAIKNGGNSDPLKTYFGKGGCSNAVSLQLGIKKEKFNTSVCYTHITGDGRYLMPREWGREIFYTYLPRERNEGYGNVNAIMAKATFSLPDKRFKNSIAYGYYKLPDVNNHRLNKYGMPSYHQLNYDASYLFRGFFKGMELRFLLVWKLKQGEIYHDLRYVYNKVNMANFNLILDFKM